MVEVALAATVLDPSPSRCTNPALDDTERDKDLCCKIKMTRA
jgi:hypothetical protein